MHILNNNGSFSPSAFIPFCLFGEDSLLVGKKISEFHFPICKIFVSKVLNNQLCYETDLGNLQDGSMEQFKMGLVLILDLNENRQFILDYEKRKEKYTHNTKNLLKRKPSYHLITIYFDTYSNKSLKFYT